MTDGETYPRDMVGYGRTPPFADWPKQARIAVQFVINYEEGGENNILHGDAASEAFLSEIIGAAPWPGMRHMNMESIYEYGSRAGFWRLHRLFTERSVPVTVYAVATAMARNREAVQAMNEARWEIATHGLKWIDYRDTPPEVEARHIAEAVRIHAEVAGMRPLGFYQGRTSVNTIRLGMEEGGFVYCADSYADDLPYWLEGPRGPQLMIPYTLDANDMRFATAAGLQHRRSVLRLSQGFLRHALRRRRRRAQDAERRPALPTGRPARTRARADAIHRLRPEPRSGLYPDPARRRPPLDREAPPARRLEALQAYPDSVHRTLRRRLRAFAMGRGGGLRRGADARRRHSRWPRQGARRRRSERDAGAEARADRGPPGFGRQARARQDADRQLDARAGERRT